MQVVTTDEAESNLARLLKSVEAGEEFLIARDNEPVAKLVPISPKVEGSRPKVGQTISPRFEIPMSALAPLSPEELKNWGL